jgi:hypothetical protein
MADETPAGTTAPAPLDAMSADPTPRLLEEGERIELWLAGQEAPDAGDSATAPHSEADQIEIDDWDVRPAQISAVALPFIAVAAGGWGLSGRPGTPSAPGARVILRRLGDDGIAEWEGTIATGAEAVAQPGPNAAADSDTAHKSARIRTAEVRGAEAILVVRLDPNAGMLHQRRRSPRLSVRLSPVRLVPLSGALPAAATALRQALAEELDTAPVARLSDVSAHGAAVVVDEPLEMGTTVAIEFELPGESDPFTVRGRVVEPAVALHGDVQPQADGLPGFRRGIEFLGHAAGRESRRLTSVLARLLQSDSSRRELS